MEEQKSYGGILDISRESILCIEIINVIYRKTSGGHKYDVVSVMSMHISILQN